MQDFQVGTQSKLYHSVVHHLQLWLFLEGFPQIFVVFLLELESWLIISVPVNLHVFNGAEVRALCGTVKLFHTELIHPCLYRP